MNLSRFFFGALLIQGCATVPQEVRRLSPIPDSVATPKECVFVSVMPGSPAAMGGIRPGDRLQSIDGNIPSDANAVAVLIDSAPADVEFYVIPSSSSSSRRSAVHLNDKKPRLGAACDLTGMQKPGFTAAGNESLTVFGGPLALTISGILDKGIAFVRVHFSNNADHAVSIDPSEFTRQSGNAPVAQALSPQDVMCVLYGEKGLKFLSLKHQQAQSLEATPSVASAETCPASLPRPHDPGASESEIKANADYISTESLWPTSVTPNNFTEGLIYFPEPSELPMRVSATVDGHSMTVALGNSRPQVEQMTESERVAFFESIKKGTPVRLTTKKGKVFVGKFESYDGVDEKVWFDDPSGGLLSSVSFSIISIRYAAKAN